MSKLILYGTVTSPPSRSVLLTLHALDLEYDFKIVDVHGGETRTEEYLKMNPQHTVPLLDDNGQYIWDSHAIITYLARKYGKTDSLYPKDFYQRAVVDQRLHFDSSVMDSAFKSFVSPHLSNEKKFEAVYQAYDFLEAFLVHTYLAGDNLTVADLSILSSVSTSNIAVPIDSAKTPKLANWLGLLKQLPYYEEVNGKGLAAAEIKIKKLIAATQI